MMDGPHIFGFSPAAFCINLTSALASARLVESVMASINAATLNLVGLVLLSAIALPFVSPKANLVLNDGQIGVNCRFSGSRPAADALRLQTAAWMSQI